MCFATAELPISFQQANSFIASVWWMVHVSNWNSKPFHSLPTHTYYYSNLVMMDEIPPKDLKLLGGDEFC